jgi:hypothetical protein
MNSFLKIKLGQIFFISQGRSKDFLPFSNKKVYSFLTPGYWQVDGDQKIFFLFQTKKV